MIKYSGCARVWVSASEDAGVTFWCSVRRAMAMMLPPEEVDGWWRREVGRHLFLPCQSLPATCCGRFFTCCARAAENTFTACFIRPPLTCRRRLWRRRPWSLPSVLWMHVVYVSCECSRCAFACAHSNRANRRRAGGNLALITPRLFCIFIGPSRRLLSAGICQQSAECSSAFF